MSAQFELKRYEIEIKIRDKKRKGILVLLLPIVFLLIQAYLPESQLVTGLVWIIIPAPLCVGIIWIFNPINRQEYAFYEIVEALKLLEKGGESKSVNEIATNRILNASQKLSELKGGQASWYIDIKKIENLFIKNLKTRIVPAILDSKSVTGYLIDIALVLLRENITMLEDVNNRLEKDLDEIEEDREIVPTFRLRISSFLFGLQEKAIGKAIICIIGGFGVVALLIFIGIRISPEFSKQVNENLLLVFGFAIALSVGLMALSPRMPSFVETPEQITVKAVPAQQTEEALRQEQIKRQTRARFIEKYYPPLIRNLKGCMHKIKANFEQGYVGNYENFFTELIERDAEGIFGMIKSLNEKIHTGLRKVVDDFIPALNSLQANQIAANKEIPKKWILFLIENSERFPITLSPQDVVSRCHFIWELWRGNHNEAKKGFDETCGSILEPEDNSESLREKIFEEMSDIANSEWAPIRRGFNTLHGVMRKWIRDQAVLPMENSLAEIMEELRASGPAGVQ